MSPRAWHLVFASITVTLLAYGWTVVDPGRPIGRSACGGRKTCCCGHGRSDPLSRSNLGRMFPALPIVISAASPTSAEAQDVSTRYYEDLVGRYHRRSATREEVLGAEAGYPNGDLVAPTGILLLARQGVSVLGCAGMRVRPNAIGEVTRVFVESAARGRGLGRLLMAELDRNSLEMGIRTLRLDTRTDLIEARGLYASLGFVEGEAHNADPYANHWFRKELV